jgi:diguanylate cyclase (GGDEF)-like protein
VRKKLKKAVFQGLAAIQGQSKSLLVAESIFLVLTVGVIDSLTSWELALSPFYLVPIFFATYYVGAGFGVFVSILCATSGLLVDLVTRIPYSHPSYHYLNYLVRLSSYFIYVSVLASLNRVLQLLQQLANTDQLTKLLNSRHFYHLAESEIQRAERYGHTMTMVYIDLDGFKEVNDNIGHAGGDKVLRVVANTLRSNCRKSDLVARLGGDEFAILIPEGGFDSAESFLKKMRDRLLEAMGQNEWRVTFSIGAVSFDTPPDSVDELVRQADSRMYAVKAAGKNSIRHERVETSVNLLQSLLP